MVGVCRPSFERVKQNIENNIVYFSNKYPQHTFTFLILTYINQFYEPLQKYCSDNNIDAYFIPHIEDNDIPVKVRYPNWYRLFYSMNYIMDKIPNNIYDCIIRLRLDTEVKNFELYDTIYPTKYYTILEDPYNGRCSDNIGYGSYNVMKKVWSKDNYLIKGFNTEEIIYRSVKKCGFSIKGFNFHFILYQSDDDIFDGVKQWSKRSREWIYDGKEYFNRNI